MSLDTLKEDLKQNLATLTTMNELSSVGDVVNHLKNTLWPTLESIVDELAEVDDCVADMVNNAEDILQPETAEVFAAVLAASAVVAAALKPMLDPAKDADMINLVAELERNIKKANAIMQEIVIDDVDPEYDDDDDDDDDDNEGDQNDRAR